MATAAFPGSRRSRGEVRPSEVRVLDYPRDGVFAPYFYRHLDPVAPVYWRLDEIALTVVRAIARYVDSPALESPRQSTRNDNESAAASSAPSPHTGGHRRVIALETMR